MPEEKFDETKQAASIISIAILTCLDSHELIRISPKYTFWFEVAALVPFRISWLIKGGFVLTDEREYSSVKSIVKEKKEPEKNLPG